MSVVQDSVEAVAATMLAAKKESKPRGKRGLGGLRFDDKRQLWIATWPRPGRSPATFYGKSMQEAIDKRDAYKADLAAGRIDPSGAVRALASLPTHPTVGEWIEYWLENEIRTRYDENGDKEGGKQPTTYENYRWIADKHILPRSIARIKLDRLRVADVEEWWNSMRRRRPKPVGRPSAYKAMVVLSGAVKRAIVRRDVTSLLMNPVNIFSAGGQVEKPRAKEKPAPKPEEVAALYAAAQGERLEMIVHLGLRLGLRRQEMAALHFGDFDFTKNVLYIRGRINRVKKLEDGFGGVIQRSGAKMRDDGFVDEVPLSRPERWKQLLEEHRARLEAFYAEHAATWRGPLPSTPWGWLFPTRNGEPMDPNEIFRWFKEIAAKAGQPDKTVHGLRHDCASLGIASGMSLWEVSKLLRHSSTNVTESVYGHITGTHEQRLYSTVDDAVDALLGGQAPQVDAASG